MTLGGNDKRKLSEAELHTPSPANRKRQDGRGTPKGSSGPFIHKGPKPIYPSRHDKQDLTDMVKKFTIMSMEPDMADVRVDRNDEYSEGETLAIKLEDQKITIINGLEKMLVTALTVESGADFNLDRFANEAETFITGQIYNILDIDATSTFDVVIRKMTSYAKNQLINELGASNIVPKFEDGPTVINKKKDYLKMLNPLRGTVISIIDNMLIQGISDRPSIVRGAGLMAKLNNEYHEIHNKVAETDKRLSLATIQIAKLTSTVTDQDNMESNKMLVIRGLSEYLSAENSGPQNRAVREQEARDYIMTNIGFTSPFSLSLPPSKSRGSGIAIVTTAFEQDKFKLERLISQARSRRETNISSKRWTPADKPFSNLPDLETLAKQLKIGMKNHFNAQLAKLRASENDQHKELADHISSTYADTINGHNYFPRKVLYGNSVQYEFQCPISKGIMMIYKGETTFKYYDFTEHHPNPRLREMVKSDPGLADTYGFAPE